jgi:hypothetical protein
MQTDNNFRGQIFSHQIWVCGGSWSWGLYISLQALYIISLQAHTQFGEDQQFLEKSALLTRYEKVELGVMLVPD